MKPVINVTPLIDVLLVLLIIFMVIVPAKPTRFEAKIPAESKPDAGSTQNPNTLIVYVESDGSLRLNLEARSGSVDDPAELIAMLREKFRFREENGIRREGTNEIEKTVFISAPRALGYGTVVRAVDAAKEAGAGPIGLQIDDLN